MSNRSGLSKFVIILSYAFGLAATLWYKQAKMTTPSLNHYYNVQLEKYEEQLGEKYKQMHVDEATNEFLEWSTSRSSSFFLQLFYAVSAPLINLFTTKTATNGLLHRGEMFVLSKDQLLSLLGHDGNVKYEEWLDLGAGDGGALERVGVKDLANSVSVTEICGVMRKRLQWRGFQLKDTEDWDDQQYDVISMFNLLDRAGDPGTFLDKAHRVLKTDGRLIIAVVLPFRPYVERGGINNKPRVDVASFQSNSKHHHDQLSSFVDAVCSRGFKLASWSVVPYLCEGDQTTAYYTLRDTILVFDKTA